MLKVLNWYSAHMSFALSLDIMKFNVNDFSFLLAKNTAFFPALNEQIQYNLLFVCGGRGLYFHVKIVVDICRHSWLNSGMF